MIHLDTNLLVELVTIGTPGAEWVRRWLEAGRPVGASAIAWSEFCNGPLSSAQKAAAYAVLDRNIVPFGKQEAEEAARLFNLAGRRRGSHADCMVAAAAISAGATVATRNRSDFERLAPYGVRLEAME